VTDVDREIVCVDCGGRCHLLTTWPDDDPPIPGDVLSYRCADCLDVWYLEIPETEIDE
jgi:DNA-directed RNA polymerase subunit RPC12/RpoP